MPNIRTGETRPCLNCGLIKYFPKAQLLKSKNHYCSVKCMSKYTAKDRGDKQRKKIYPFWILLSAVFSFAFISGIIWPTNY